MATYEASAATGGGAGSDGTFWGLQGTRFNLQVLVGICGGTGGDNEPDNEAFTRVQSSGHRGPAEDFDKFVMRFCLPQAGIGDV